MVGNLGRIGSGQHSRFITDEERYLDDGSSSSSSSCLTSSAIIATIEESNAKRWYIQDIRRYDIYDVIYCTVFANKAK